MRLQKSGSFSRWETYRSDYVKHVCEWSDLENKLKEVLVACNFLQQQKIEKPREFYFGCSILKSDPNLKK